MPTQFLDYAPGENLTTAPTDLVTTPLHLAVSLTTSYLAVPHQHRVCMCPALDPSMHFQPKKHFCNGVSLYTYTCTWCVLIVDPSLIHFACVQLKKLIVHVLQRIVHTLYPPPAHPLQAYHGHYGILGELVYKYQSYLDSKDEKGRTPLDLAAFRGHK